MENVTIYISLANKIGQLTIDGDFGLFATFFQTVCERGLVGALKDSEHDSRDMADKENK